MSAATMSDAPDDAVDVAIIGAGPIGIELAAAFKHTGVKYRHIDAGPIGSTIGWWATGTQFFSSPERIAIAGVPITSFHQQKTTREEYLAYLRAVVQQFDLGVQIFRRVANVNHMSRDAFEITTAPSAHGVGGPDEVGDSRSTINDAQQKRTRVRKVVLAIGNMHRPRMLAVAGEDLPHVSHYLGEPHSYFGRRVLIVGGKNSAVEAALRLYRVGARVAISHRGAEFDAARVKYWLRPELEWLIQKKRIEFFPRTLVQSIQPNRVVLRPLEGDAPREVPAEVVLLLTGYVQDPQLFEQLGVELIGDERAPRFDANTMETNVPGVYVAGTAAGGSQQRARLFIENTHVHVRRIVRAVAGADVPWRTDLDFGMLEQ